MVESLGIRKIAALVYYVRDLARVRRFMTEQLDFAELGESGRELTERGRQRSALFQAGDVNFLVCAPEGEGGRAWRYLRKHPEGVGTIVFEVDDLARTFALLDERGGTIIADIERFSDPSGTLAMFSITTPFGDTTFRFIERKGYRPFYPGMVAYDAPRGGQNRLGWKRIDHVTSNFQTLAPTLLWLEHVMGFERYWSVQFHTEDVAKGNARGSGLRSVVMMDPGSKIKFAHNEPLRPHFKSSQINVFGEDHRGDGVQHAALAVPDIISTVTELRRRGVAFMPTPSTYYDLLPARLARLGVGEVDEALATLRELEILVDGEGPRQYLLQIFLQEAAGLHHDPEAGPFFFEIIQRRGSNGFGAGNFRALFESIERQQAEQRSLGETSPSSRRLS
jgi:4-hydroxyphenylpyruvate dioxygenase